MSWQFTEAAQRLLMTVPCGAKVLGKRLCRNDSQVREKYSRGCLENFRSRGSTSVRLKELRLYEP